MKAALSTLAANGHPATDTTRQAIATTLRALPTDDPPGRLSTTLQPGGFEMLAGLSIGGGPSGRASKVPAASKEMHQRDPQRRPLDRSQAPHRSTARPPTHHPHRKHRTRRQPRVRERLPPKRARELREAEHTARREEFEAARATRDAEKAARQLAQAREALAAAQREVEEARGPCRRSGAHESRRRAAGRSGRTRARGSEEEGRSRKPEAES